MTSFQQAKFKIGLFMTISKNLKPATEGFFRAPRTKRKVSGTVFFKIFSDGRQKKARFGENELKRTEFSVA